MNRKLVILSGLCLTTSLITSAAVSTAQAGFQWNPPPRAAAPGAAASPAQNSSAAGGPLTPMPGDVAAAVPIEPVSEVDMMDGAKPLPPVTTTNVPAGMKSINFQSSSAPQSLMAGSSNIESDVLLPIPGQTNNAAVSAAAMPPVSPMSTAPDAPVVEGFGNDIPLAVALRQIVPPKYMLSFAPGLDQGKPVSWNGGKAWPEVVNEMLSSRKLHASLQGNTLNVAQGAGSGLTLPADLPVIYDDSAKVAANDTIDSPIPSAGRPVLNLAQQQRWEAKPGQGLRETLLGWSKAAHVELAWQDVPDMPIGSAFNFDGTFDQAVDSLLSLYSGGATEPRGKLYPNLPEGPSVLVVSSSN